MEKRIPVKNLYLLMVISIGLVFLAVGSTYAMFTASSEIADPISFTSNLSYNGNILDTVTVSVDAGERVRSTLNITNSSGSILNYSAWYVNSGVEDVEIGIYEGTSNGSLASGESISIVVDIRNGSTISKNIILGVSSSEESVVLSDAMVNITDTKISPSFVSGSTWYSGSTDKTTITKIIFDEDYTVTGSETESWAAAEDMDGDGTNDSDIMCYLNGTELTIVGNGTGKIYTNENSDYMFAGFKVVTTIDNIAILNTSNATTMAYMFYQCEVITSLDLSNFDTSNVKDMSAMFRGCNALTTLDLSSFDTSNVTTMDYMFSYCQALTTLDLSNFNTSNVTTMSYMFNYCQALTTLDLSNFNTSNVTTMSYMFNYCSSVTSFIVSSFNTSKVQDMSAMFRGCSALTTLDLSSFDTSNVTNMSGMFVFDSALKTITFSSLFTATNVTDMSYMFHSCSALTTLDLSSFNTAKVTNMNYMFRYCSGLKTIYVSSSWSTSAVTASAVMFQDCTNLVGGNGTKYNSSYIDGTYARIDRARTPGYLTKK